MNALLENIEKLHTTELGIARIRRNLSLDADDVVAWCRMKILDPAAVIEKRGKNWYAAAGHCRITINAYSYTLITAHKV